MDKTFKLRQLPAWSPSAASLARITRSIGCIFGKLGPSASPLVALALAALLFCGLAVPTAMADFPPALVIDSVVYPAVPVSGTSGVVSYSSANGVLVLHGATGGVAGWGADESTALNTPSLSGTWHNDCSQPILLSGPEPIPSIVIPQVIVSYWPGGGENGYMHGYDGNAWQAPAGICYDASGNIVAAYNGLAAGYIFNLDDGSPIYRYQAGTGPVIINAGNGWPQSSVSVFPRDVHYGADKLTFDSFTEGIGDGYIGLGYWSNIYYKGTKPDNVTQVYGEMHLFIPSDGSTAQMWGYMEDAAVSAQWDSATHMFVADSNLGVTLTNLTAATGPAYGPPNLEYSGTILWFKYRDINNSDVYCDNQKQIWAVVNSSGWLTVSSANGISAYSYNSVSRQITRTDTNPYAGDISAVNAEGTEFLGLLDGVSVIANGGNTSVLEGASHTLQRPDGTVLIKYNDCWNPRGAPGTFFQCGGSPIYRVDANLVIDATAGWPATNAQYPQTFPAYVGVNGRWLHLDLVDGPSVITGDWSNPFISIGATYSYSEPSGWSVQIYSQTDLNGSQVTSYLINSVCYADAASAAAAGYTITPVAASSQIGPPEVVLNGTTAMFSYSNNGADVYSTAIGGGTLPFQVTIDSNSLVTVVGTQPNLSGTYNASTYQFNLNGGTLLAQDATGNLLGTASGLVIYSAAPWSGSVLLAGGNSSDGDYSTWGGAIYKFKRNDGSYGIKFLGIPQGSLFIVQNPDGTVSPYYRYSENSGDFILNTVASEGFPSSSIWPRQLYVNGHYTALDASSEVVSNGGYTRQVSYHVQPGGETITVNWSGNSGAVVGSYGSYGSFLGTWDGGNLFGSLPNGLVITTSPPSYIARFGPPQIKWNGVELVFDPLASAVSASNPQGMDIYRDSLGLGLSARIGSNGAVTLYQADGSQLTGTYDSGTYQFNFGTQPAGSIQADSAQGFVLHSSSGRGTSGEPGTNNATMEAPGNFDIQGNVFSLGNWTNASGNSTPGLMLTFTSGSNNQASVLRFGAVRKTTDWVWSHADPDGSSSQITAMKLDSANRLQLFDPAVQTTGTTAKATIVLDPAVSGTSRFKGPVQLEHVLPLGDIEMGSFTTGNAPQ